MQSVTLEVLGAEEILATANVVNLPQFQQPFGADGRISSGPLPVLLFKLPSAQAVKIASALELSDVTPVDAAVRLRVRVVTTDNSEATLTWSEGGMDKKVPVLIRYKGDNRFGGRNPSAGGDDWVMPSVRPVCDFFADKDVLFNDFSNMNGGLFSPHAIHKDGTDVDGYFPGYNKQRPDGNFVLPKEAAQQLIGYLNQAAAVGLGGRIAKCWVSMDAWTERPLEGAEIEHPESVGFKNALKGVRLADGRLATDVIKHKPNRLTYFEWHIDPIIASPATANMANSANRI